LGNKRTITKEGEGRGKGCDIFFPSRFATGREGEVTSFKKCRGENERSGRVERLVFFSKKRREGEKEKKKNSKKPRARKGEGGGEVSRGQGKKDARWGLGKVKQFIRRKKTGGGSNTSKRVPRFVQSTRKKKKKKKRVLVPRDERRENASPNKYGTFRKERTRWGKWGGDKGKAGDWTTFTPIFGGGGKREGGGGFRQSE